MDNQSLHDLHRGLCQEGFQGSLERLQALWSAQERETLERQFLRAWGLFPNCSAQRFLKATFAHARRRMLGIALSGGGFEILSLSPSSDDSTVRLAWIEFSDRSVRCVFYRGNECLGERMVAWRRH